MSEPTGQSATASALSAGAGRSAAAPLLCARSVHRTYRLGRVLVPVLRGASVDVRPGEWVAILGASGSGKSTLLHLLGGLDRPNTGPNVVSPGEILYRGQSLARYSEGELDAYRRSQVGLVFQFYHLLPELTVLANVTMAAMIRHGFGYSARAAQVRNRARELLDAFGLGARLDHRPVELSGGERQRVAIARALINQPAVLLADEPTGNLDQKTGSAILDLIAQHRQRTGLTMVVVTHDLAVARRADRVVRLVDGKVAGDGTGLEADRG